MPQHCLHITAGYIPPHVLCGKEVQRRAIESKAWRITALVRI